MLAATWWP